MRRAMAILGCALALAACRKSEPSASKPGKVTTTVIPEKVSGKKDVVIHPDIPAVVEKTLLGSKLAADGTVVEETNNFKSGEPIALTIWLTQSPPGLATGAIWYDGGGAVLEREKRPMNGGKVATFSPTVKLKPGVYRVEGYWGGNIIAEKTFEVAGGGKKK